MKPLVRHALVVLAVAAAGWYVAPRMGQQPALAGGQPAAAGAEQLPPAAATPDEARKAFEQRASGRMLHANGTVQRTLADDRDGSPHQRFIIVTDSGLSLLVAHNIALAPRLDGLAAGDAVQLYGEYEWNDKGGVMHWTHHDPGGNHPDGYIEWRGRRYR